MSYSANEKTIGIALKGFSWNVGGNFTRSIAGFIINITLARLLGPEPFGVVALALLVIGIGNLFIESGLSSALVQQQEIEHQDIAFVFTFQMSFAIGLAILIIAIAPWLAIQFASPEAAPVLQVMSIILVLQAFAQVPSSLLRRELNFKRLQMAQIISFFAGYLCLGLPLAFSGFGVWSLVAAQVVQSGSNALLVYFSSHHSLSFNFKGSHHLTLFGIRILAANIASWIIQYVDQTIIGHRFGAKNLGFYSRAYFLNWTPTGIVLASAQASLFSAVSRMGRSTESTRIFTGFMSAFSIFFFSIYWFVALESQNIIEIIYGKEWLPAAALLTPLAFAMPFLVLVGLEGPVLSGLGKPQYEMWAQWLTAFFAILVLSAASHISLVVTAWSILLIYLLRLSIMSFITTQVLEISWMQLIRPIIPGFGMGIITILAWYLSDSFIATETLLIEFAGRGLVVIFVWVLTFWMGRTWFFPDFSSWTNFLKNRIMIQPLSNSEIAK